MNAYKPYNRIDLYVWTSKLNDKDNPSPYVKLHDMNNDRQGYNPDNNVRELTRFLLDSFPGNTIDLLVDAIETEIKSMLDTQEHIDILKSCYDIGNRVRNVLSDLSQIE